MASGDTFGITSYAPVAAGKGESTQVTSYATSVQEVSLVSLSPDPVMYGQTLVVTGVNLDSVQQIVVDGISVSFTIISPTQINVMLPVLTQGVKSIYAEFV